MSRAVSRRLSAAALALLLAACMSHEPPIVYERVHLPGFSLELPDFPSASAPAGASDYPAGSLMRARKARPVMIAAVMWTPGGVLTAEETDAVAKVIGIAIGKPGVTPRLVDQKREKIRGTLAVRATLDLGPDVPFRIALIDVACGARSVTVAAAAESDPARIAERITGSLDCRPDPAREAELATGGTPIAFDALPVGWRRLDNQGTYTISDGTSFAVFTPVANANAVSEVELAKLIPSLMGPFVSAYEQSRTESVTRHGNTRELVYGTATFDGQPSGFVIAMWTCDTGVGVLGMGIHDIGASADAVVDIVMRARCKRPGEKPVELPGAPVAPRFPVRAE